MNYTLTIGRIVWYKLDTGPHKGEYRPAIVVRVFGPTCVNLQVFLDGSNDHPTFYTQWVSSASYGKDERQWLWPNEV